MYLPDKIEIKFRESEELIEENINFFKFENSAIF
jgi:hypothetical protein